MIKAMKQMKAVIPAIVVLLLFFNSGCKFFKERPLFSKDVDSLVDLSDKKVTESKKESIEQIDEEVPETEPETVSQPERADISGYYEGGNYYMIVGSFQNEHFAERYAEKIQQMGYQTKIIASPHGYYRVSAKSYSTLNQGINDLERFRADVASRAWIHIKK